MNLVRIAYAYARRSPLATLLNLLLLTLGVATITLLLLLTTALDERLKRDAAAIDLVIGAKGSPLQLVLAGVYHVDVPPGNIPLEEVERLRRNPLIREVIPVALGDSYRGYHIVGTEPAFLGLYGARPLRDAARRGEPAAADQRGILAAIGVTCIRVGAVVHGVRRRDRRHPRLCAVSDRCRRIGDVHRALPGDGCTPIRSRHHAHLGREPRPRVRCAAPRELAAVRCRRAPGGRAGTRAARSDRRVASRRGIARDRRVEASSE